MENARKRLRWEVLAERRVLHWILGGGLLVLLWRALGRCEDWEAAALGFPLVLVLTAPPGYYISCLVPIAMLARQRPRLQFALLCALVGWCLANLGFYNSVQEFAIEVDTRCSIVKMLSRGSDGSSSRTAGRTSARRFSGSKEVRTVNVSGSSAKGG